MTEQHYPDCEELRGIQFLFIVGRTEPPNHVNTFYIDSAAYLQVEFIKTSSSNTTVEYWGYCGAGPFTGREYSSTQESPNLTVTETIPTLGAGKAFERSVQYQVIGTPNNAGFQSVRASLTAGETTVVKFEY